MVYPAFNLDSEWYFQALQSHAHLFSSVLSNSRWINGYEEDLVRFKHEEINLKTSVKVDFSTRAISMYVYPLFANYIHIVSTVASLFIYSV
jgi:hypothetical protein